MVVCVEPRFYGSLATRYDKSPIFNLDLLLALYQPTGLRREVYADDDGVLILEEKDTALPRNVVLDSTSVDSAKALLSVLEEETYSFLVRERWLTLIVQTSWDVFFEEVEPKRYSTDSTRFSGKCQHEVIEVSDVHEGLIKRFVETRDDLEENLCLEDLLVWKQKGRKCQIFVALEKGEIQSYLLAMPVCAELSNIWHVEYVYTPPERRDQGYAASVLCRATEALLNSNRLPVITPRNPRMKESCERLGFCVSDQRLRGIGTRLG